MPNFDWSNVNEQFADFFAAEWDCTREEAIARLEAGDHLEDSDNAWIGQKLGRSDTEILRMVVKEKRALKRRTW